jgi:hypothetical protein
MPQLDDESYVGGSYPTRVPFVQNKFLSGLGGFFDDLLGAAKDVASAQSEERIARDKRRAADAAAAAERTRAAAAAARAEAEARARREARIYQEREVAMRKANPILAGALPQWLLYGGVGLLAFSLLAKTKRR